MPMNVIEIGAGAIPPAPGDDEKFEMVPDHDHGSNGALDDPDEIAMVMDATLADPTEGA